MKKVFSGLCYLLGVLPILSLLSIIIVGVTLFIGNFISGYCPKISPDLVVKIICLILNLIYVVAEFPKGIKEKSFWVLSVLLVISIVLIIVSYSFPYLLLLYYVPFSLSVLLSNEKLDSIRKAISKNKATLTFFNTFDIFYIILMYFLFKIDLTNIFQIKITVFKEFELLLIIGCGVIIYFIIPLIREILAIYIYKWSNQISLGEGKVLWNTHIKNYLVSVLVCFLYFGLLISPAIKDLTVISIISVYVFPSIINLFFWSQLFEQIDKGGEERSNVLLLWKSIFIILLLLIIFDQIGKEFISILSWLLPVLIPIFIGEVNSLDSNYFGKKATQKMKKHLYMLQIICFNTLVFLNILTSLPLDKIFSKNKNIVKGNDVKEILEKLLNAIPDFNKFPEFLLSIFASIILVVTSFLIAMIFSNMMMSVFKRLYLNEDYYK
mgnify:CR=1 FL=1